MDIYSGIAKLALLSLIAISAAYVPKRPVFYLGLGSLFFLSGGAK